MFQSHRQWRILSMFPRFFPQERVMNRTVEMVVDVPVPETVEEIANVPKIIPKKVMNSMVEQILNVPVPQTAEEIVNVVVMIFMHSTCLGMELAMNNTYFRADVQVKASEASVLGRLLRASAVAIVLEASHHHACASWQALGNFLWVPPSR
eukprot:4824065-Amphidinium_carterae.2